MRKEELFEAMRGIDESLILDAAPRNKTAKVHVAWKYAAIAACLIIALSVYPIIRLLVPNPDEKYQPILITYSSLAEMEAALGFETLFSKPEFFGIMPSVLYSSGDGRDPNYEEPVNVIVASNFSDRYSTRGVLLNIVFGTDNIDELKTDGYGELKLRYKIKGIEVYGAELDENEYTTEIAAFKYSGKIYTVEMPVFEYGTTMEEYLGTLIV